ncbi:MAG: 30S ribosomal protein S6 [Candidatus Omnitrophica bacterium]|nr:30S ribosomal protein S6 [Candidatus Omnitrophota bacterium]
MEKSRSYSGLFIISPEKQEELSSITDGIKNVISENSGNVVNENMMGKRSLAYPINNKEEGVYYDLTFTALPGSISKILKLFRINTDILRTLIDKAE